MTLLLAALLLSAPAQAIENTVSAEASAFGADAVGAGLRYGRTVASSLLFRRVSVVDELELEAAGYARQQNQLSTKVDLRYGLQIGETFQPFVYGGAIRNFGLESGLRPAAGAGLLMSVGHRWSLRAEAGVEAVGGGASYHF
jgi:hypothetical protein